MAREIMDLAWAMRQGIGRKSNSIDVYFFNMRGA
jgi:hypothetical protein